MILNVYSVRDALTGYMSPTFEVSDPVAMRNFEYAVRNTESLLGSHPEHYSLFKIGTYDSDTGVLNSLNPQEFICDAMMALKGGEI